VRRGDAAGGVERAIIGPMTLHHRTPAALLFVLLSTAAGCSPSTGEPSGSTSGTSSGSSTSTASSTSSGSLPDAGNLGATDTLATSAGNVKMTPIHHATVLFTQGGKNIYIDPITEGGKLDGLPKADLIFITHAHGDHLNPAAIELLKKPETQVFGPESVVATIPSAVVMHNGDTKTFGAISVLAFAMYNLTRGPSAGKLYHDKGAGNGYVLTFGDKKVYASGDTECTDELKALKGLDVAFLCMNLPYTMPPAEAADCAKAFQPKVVYPYHYRGSEPAEFQKALAGTPEVEVRLRTWY
jgi:L-ascorbate metabolism protein UlaG (beta-lactamase superfamily)